MRDVVQALATSPTQLYRLLDPTNYSKSARQLLSLLALLGASVKITDARPTRRARRGRKKDEAVA